MYDSTNGKSAALKIYIMNKFKLKNNSNWKSVENVRLNKILTHMFVYVTIIQCLCYILCNVTHHL